MLCDVESATMESELRPGYNQLSTAANSASNPSKAPGMKTLQKIHIALRVTKVKSNQLDKFLNEKTMAGKDQFEFQKEV